MKTATANTMAKQKTSLNRGSFFVVEPRKSFMAFAMHEFQPKNTIRVQKILKNGKNLKYEVKKGIYQTIKNTKRVSSNKIKNTYRV